MAYEKSQRQTAITKLTESHTDSPAKLGIVEESKSPHARAPEGMMGSMSQGSGEMLEDDLPVNSFVGDKSLPTETGPEGRDAFPAPESQAVHEVCGDKKEAVRARPGISSVEEIEGRRSPYQEMSEKADEANGSAALTLAGTPGSRTTEAYQSAGDERTEADPRKAESAQPWNETSMTGNTLKVLEEDNKEVRHGDGKIRSEVQKAKPTKSEVHATMFLATVEQGNPSKKEVTSQGPVLRSNTSEEAGPANESPALRLAQTTGSRITEASQSIEHERLEGEPPKVEKAQVLNDSSATGDKLQMLQRDKKEIHEGDSTVASDVQKKDLPKSEAHETMSATKEQGDRLEKEVTTATAPKAPVNANIQTYNIPTQKDPTILDVSPTPSVSERTETSRKDGDAKAIEAKPIVEATIPSNNSIQKSSYDDTEDALDIGSKVECRFQDTTKWFPGSIQARHPKANGLGFLYNILYDDGDHEKGVRRLKIRLPSEKQRALLEIGEEVDAKSPNKKGVEGAVVVEVNPDGTYKLCYDSGPTLAEVERKYIFGKYSKAPGPPSIKESTGAQENSTQDGTSSISSMAPQMKLEQATPNAEHSKADGPIYAETPTKTDLKKAALVTGLSKGDVPAPTEAMDHSDPPSTKTHPPLLLPYPQFTGFLKVRSAWGMVHGQVFLNYEDKLTQFLVHAPSGPPEVDLENDKRAINALRDLFIKKYR